jgi:DNA polymerase sigma
MKSLNMEQRIYLISEVEKLLLKEFPDYSLRVTFHPKDIRIGTEEQEV